MSQLHMRLKTITKPLHDEIEQNRFSKVLLGEQPDIQTYKAFLLKILRFLEPIETAMANTPQWKSLGLSKVCRLKLDDIRTDLGILGVSIDDDGKRPQMPKLNSFFEILGAWYVMEGSMVGASMQAPILRKNLGIDEQTGLKYMSGYGASTFEVWKSFIAILEDTTKTKQDQKAIILAACDTFLSLRIWLDED